MAIRFTRLFSPLSISLLILRLGFTNANPVVLDPAEIRSPPIAPAFDSSEILTRQTGIPPGECDVSLSEVLEYSECKCNNIMTSWCWTSEYGPKGSTKSYQAACNQNQTCMESIVQSYTAQCVDSDRFGTMEVEAQVGYTCEDFNFIAYGAIQVVARVTGGCPPSSWPNYATYSDSSSGQYFGSASVGYYEWLSPAFQATGNAVHVCLVYQYGPPITVAIAFTPQLPSSCPWC